MHSFLLGHGKKKINMRLCQAGGAKFVSKCRKETLGDGSRTTACFCNDVDGCNGSDTRSVQISIAPLLLVSAIRFALPYW